jgi:hypothetical protein
VEEEETVRVTRCGGAGDSSAEQEEEEEEGGELEVAK